MTSPARPPTAVTPGLGAHPSPAGTSFALWSPRADRVELILIGADRSQTPYDLTCGDDGVWRGSVPGIGAGQRYGFRVHGAWDPDRGMRFNPAKLLLDPYARAITGRLDYAGPICDHLAGPDVEPCRHDSAAAVPLSVVVADSPPPPPVATPVSLADSVIYELHVKGFTQLHPGVPEQLRGRYAGLAQPAVTAYLKGLGVTAVELLPVHEFVSEPSLIARGVSNYWGYNSVGFFAPHSGYASAGTAGQQVGEFKAMVTALHDAGIEVILDVVYNHTGESGPDGPTLAFRGLDHLGYYRLTNDRRGEYDVTGCGNAVNTAEPQVLTLVLDSLRYWVTEMGVDGFRFDLASTLIRDGQHHVDHGHPFAVALRSDPVLSRVKVIVEPWDLGPAGYQVGAFGPVGSEWNDRFRNFVRDFWRGHSVGVAELGHRLVGSPDLFDAAGRPPTASLNFVTAHDGFTLCDLVSYDAKHNGANGEDNRDGSDDNRSANYGVEGATDDTRINALRHRQAQNLMATLLLAAGVPMLTAGDESGRTQQGNNNAYCQDSAVSWVHWSGAEPWSGTEPWSGLGDLTRTLLRLRAQHPVFRRRRYRHGEPVLDSTGRPTGRKNLAWFGGRRVEMTTSDWHDQTRRTLGLYLADDELGRDQDEAYLVWFHGAADPVRVELPDGDWADAYTVLAHSGVPGELPAEKLTAGSTLLLPGRSVVVLAVD